MAETPLIRGIGKALVIGTIISGMLLAPFPAPTVEAQPSNDGALPPPLVPTADVRGALQGDVKVFGSPEVVTQDHKKKLPLPPAPIVDSVGIDVHAAQWPHPGQTADLGISVGHDDLRRSNDCYYFTGPVSEVGTDYSECWETIHREFNDWFDFFLCGSTCYSLYGNNYYFCKIERFGDGVAKYDDSRPSHTTVSYQEGEYYADVYPSDGDPYKVAVTLVFHP